MRTKARGLSEHGGTPGWLEVSLTGAAQLRADGISSCWFIVNVHNNPSCAIACKEGMA
jgi:hypothetical protein